MPYSYGHTDFDILDLGLRYNAGLEKSTKKARPNREENYKHLVIRKLVSSSFYFATSATSNPLLLVVLLPFQTLS